jgi:hypothetical protein
MEKKEAIIMNLLISILKLLLLSKEEKQTMKIKEEYFHINSKNENPPIQL